jgi:hypothetical protein
LPNPELAAYSRTLNRLFAKRRARLKWVVALPSIVGLLFAGMALDDGGFAAAAPYVCVVLMSGLYVFRPMMILWAPVFAAFVAYAVIILVNPLVNPRNSSLNEWFIFLLLGIVPAFLLWLARPGDFVGPSTDS